MNKVKTIIYALIAAVLLVFCGWLLFTFFYPQTKQTSRLCLRYERMIITDTADIVFPRAVVKVQAKHVFDDTESDATFTVKVVPNADAVFSFRVGNVPYRFADVDDLTPAFDIVIEQDGLTLDARDIALQSVLDRLFVGAVTLPEDLPQAYFFTLSVTSASGETVTINFRSFVPATGVELAPNSEEVTYL